MANKKKIEDWQIEDAERLDSLFKEHARVNQTEFGARYGIGTQGMVWQYLSGRRPLNIKAAEAFSRGLNIPVDEFSPTIAEQIRSAASRVENPLPWPLISIDQRKVSRLDRQQLAKLEEAMHEAAAQLGIDIKKEG